MQELYNNGDSESKGLRSVDFHHVQNTWHDVDFGGSPSVIYGCTPIDMMHSLQHGLMMYAQEEIYRYFTPKYGKIIDMRIKEISQLRQSVKTDFPRSDFTNGITNLSFKTCNEQSGCIFMLMVLLSMAPCEDIHEQIGNRQKVNGIVLSLETMLCYEQWTKRDSFWIVDDFVAMIAANTEIQRMLTKLKTNLPRQTGQGWKVPKFHEQLHAVRFINKNGSPQNYNAARPENHPIDTCKKPAKTAQKRHAVITEQLFSAGRQGTWQLGSSPLYPHVCKIMHLLPIHTVQFVY